MTLVAIKNFERGIILASREYFYKDEQGKTKRYVYCSMCQTGPFKEEESDKYIKFEFGYPVFYCTKCSFNLNLKNPTSLLSPAYLRDVEVFQKAEETSEKAVEKAPAEKIEVPVMNPVPEPIPAPEPVLEPIPAPKYDISNLYDRPIKKGVNGTSYVYMLECSDSSILSGIVKDLDNAIDVTNLDKSKLPAELVYYKSFKKGTEAEKFLKGIKKRNLSSRNSLIRNFEKSYLNRTF